MGSLLSHSLTAADMMSDWTRTSTGCPVGVCLCIRDPQRQTWRQCTERRTGDQNRWQAQADHCDAGCAVADESICRVQETCIGDCCCAKGAGCCSSHSDDTRTGSSKACMQAADSSCSCCHNRQLASSHQAAVRSRVSSAAAAMMQTCSLTASGSGLQWRVIDLCLEGHLNHSDCAATGSSSSCTTERCQGDCNTSSENQLSSVDGASGKQQMQGGLSEVLLDDEWKALEEAQVVVWDLAEELQQSEQWLSLGLSAVPGNSASTAWIRACLQIQIPSLSSCVPVFLVCCPPYAPETSHAPLASRHMLCCNLSSPFKNMHVMWFWVTVSCSNLLVLCATGALRALTTNISISFLCSCRCVIV